MDGDKRGGNSVPARHRPFLCEKTVIIRCFSDVRRCRESNRNLFSAMDFYTVVSYKRALITLGEGRKAERLCYD